MTKEKPSTKTAKKPAKKRVYKRKPKKPTHVTMRKKGTDSSCYTFPTTIKDGYMYVQVPVDRVDNELLRKNPMGIVND